MRLALPSLATSLLLQEGCGANQLALTQRARCSICPGSFITPCSPDWILRLEPMAPVTRPAAEDTHNKNETQTRWHRCATKETPGYTHTHTHTQTHTHTNKHPTANNGHVQRKNATTAEYIWTVYICTCKLIQGCAQTHTHTHTTRHKMKTQRHKAADIGSSSKIWSRDDINSHRDGFRYAGGSCILIGLLPH